MMLHYNESSKSTHPPEGVDIYVPNFGDTYSVENLDPQDSQDRTGYFKEMNEFLVTKLGYIKNETLFAAPYDFRKAPSKDSRLNFLYEVHSEIS